MVAIRYNKLNLPDTVQFTNGNQIINHYDATGNRYKTSYRTRKVAATVPLGTTLSATDNLTDYTLLTHAMDKNMKYRAYGNDALTLDYVFNSEGYYAYLTDAYFYYIKDHLGNIRETYVYPWANYKECVQRMQYYPSGLPWNENFGAMEHPYRYNGKEFVEMHGLEEYDSEARWYYPALGRTTTIDPLAEKYYSISPYAWCNNNPTKFVDPTGRKIELSNMSDEELGDYKQAIAQYREYSDIFNTLYSALEDSEDVYTVQYGQTITVQGETEPVAGQFVPNKNGGGTVTFKDKVSVISVGIVGEEFFHAYQHENRFGYENGAFNREFEAKVLQMLLQPYFGGADVFTGEFRDKIFYGYYGDGKMWHINPVKARSAEFRNDYINAANIYATGLDTNHKTYLSPTVVAPYSLINLICLTYE